MYDNTIIVFTSDHGDMRGEHDRINKASPLEGSLKIPLIINTLLVYNETVILVVSSNFFS